VRQADQTRCPLIAAETPPRQANPTRPKHGRLLRFQDLKEHRGIHTRVLYQIIECGDLLIDTGMMSTFQVNTPAQPAPTWHAHPSGRRPLCISCISYLEMTGSRGLAEF
jgi:hypothetical protein